jgi:hypothetical protein
MRRITEAECCELLLEDYRPVEQQVADDAYEFEKLADVWAEHYLGAA